MSTGDIFNPVIKYIEESRPLGHFSGEVPGIHISDRHYRRLNRAFIYLLGDKESSGYSEAETILKDFAAEKNTEELAGFYLEGAERIRAEIIHAAESNRTFAEALEHLEKFASDGGDFSSPEAVDLYWSAFFPEAAGIFDEKELRKKALRKKRTVRIIRKNMHPITDPGKEMIFTSNILLTAPPASLDHNNLGLTESLKKEVLAAAAEEQVFYYDHPVQIGTQAEANEIIYGLKGLNETAEWEKKHGYMDKNGRLTCILSVSVTHKGLQKAAREYIRNEINKFGTFDHLDIYVFTEKDTEELVEQVLIPAADILESFSASTEESSTREKKKRRSRNTALLKSVFGVDGEYGRHYSFLKAIAAFWNVFIDNEKRATFKIDLDQVFPENELKAQTGKSAFEHFKDPLWGAEGTDSDGKPVELGMIAGALINEKDTGRGIFTPDVEFDNRRALSMEERFFYSKLMMGFSTEAELGVRYREGDPDGNSSCLQRIHVTGGTNGILVESLKKHRPFTPVFTGRAEDQAYILSVLGKNRTGLAYLHEDGLIMRHDKEAFAAEAIKAASAGNMIGDFIRTLYFSRYAGIISNDISEIKGTADPFTGCFISRIPVTTVLIRFFMKAEDLFAENMGKGSDFILKSFRRLREAINYSCGPEESLKHEYENNRMAWDYFYDILAAVEDKDKTDSVRRMSLQVNAARICAGCKI